MKTVTVSIAKMNESVSNPSFTEKQFSNKTEAIAFAYDVCEKYSLENFDGNEAGGIGYDYRLTVE